MGWDHTRGTAVIHMPYDARLPQNPPTGSAVALDAGVTEVWATNTGEELGHGYGKLLEQLTEETTQTGKGQNPFAPTGDEGGDSRRHGKGQPDSPS